MLRISLLGEMSIAGSAGPITGIDTPRLKSLLAYLVLHKDFPQSRSHLAFIFWPDTDEAQARTNLRNLLHQLRERLPGHADHLLVDTHYIQWRPGANICLDVDELKQAYRQYQGSVKNDDLSGSLDALQKVVSIYKGDLLQSCFDEWVIPLREELQQSYLTALEHLVEIHEVRREYESAINYAQRLVRNNPLHEAAYRWLMRLQALNGNRAGALQAFHTCSTVLKRELDVEPSPATQEVYQQLLGAPSGVMERHSSPSNPSLMVGREGEWSRLVNAWRDVSSGRKAYFMMISGEAGIGKTRLAEEMLQWATRQGITCASARCYAAEGQLAFNPLVTWLRSHPLAAIEDTWLTEIGRLLPEIFSQRKDLARPITLIESWQRQHLFEALARAVLGLRQPLLLTIDDLQWCDRDSLEWLHFLLRFRTDSRVMIVGTYRPEEINDAHPLVPLMRSLRLDEQLIEIDLSPLNEEGTYKLAKEIAGREIAPLTLQHLYTQTEGNPLFVVEMIRAGLPVMVNQPGLKNDLLQEGENRAMLPPRVQSIIETRLSQLLPSTRELAEVAAAIGREFAFDLLLKASGLDEDVLVHCLDELWRRRIIRENATESYDFSHEKLREVAYDNMSAARRRIVHLHIAQALTALHPQELQRVSHRLADHYQKAGQPQLAVNHYLQAAQYARGTFSNEEALTILQHGLALIQAFKPAEQGFEEAKKLLPLFLEELGDIQEIKMGHEEAFTSYHHAKDRVPGEDPAWQARLLRKLAVVRREQRLYEPALQLCSEAEKILGPESHGQSAAWWNEWLELQVEKVWVHYWLAQWQEMEKLVNQLESTITERGSGINRMRFLMANCLLNLRKDRYVVSSQMLVNSKEALGISMDHGNLRARIDCQFEYGFLYLWKRELGIAKKHLQDALKMAERSGILPVQVLCLTYLTVVERFGKNIDNVEQLASQAGLLAAAISMPDYVAASRGNLAWCAWRRDDLSQVLQLAQEALSTWEKSPLVYPFQWQALWPLLGMALRTSNENDALKYLDMLLEPRQQPPPAVLNDSLEEAERLNHKGERKQALSCLQTAIDTAHQLGYL